MTEQEDWPVNLGACIRCDRAIASLKPPCIGNPDDAMEGRFYGHYGSRHDLRSFLAWICDDCVDKISPEMMDEII